MFNNFIGRDTIQPLLSAAQTTPFFPLEGIPCLEFLNPIFELIYIQISTQDVFLNKTHIRLTKKKESIESNNLSQLTLENVSINKFSS